MALITSSVSLDETPALLEAIRARIQGQPDWDSAITRVLDPALSERAHLAVMHEPYLSYVLTGRKSVESRFSRNRIAPFNQVRDGDVLLLKSQSGPITGIAQVAQVDSYVLDPATWASIRTRFAAALCADDERFWAERSGARYATLMRLACAASIDPLQLQKRDRRPWVVLIPRPKVEVHRDQFALIPESPMERRLSESELVIRYQMHETTNPDQLQLVK